MKLKSLLKEIEVLGQKLPIPLSSIPPTAARKIAKRGLKDKDSQDDVIISKPGSIAVSKIRASQTVVIKEKAFGMAIGFLKDGWVGVDLGAIISSSPHYMMDGHHRWAAIHLIDPSAKVKVTVIDLPAQALVSVLNIVTASFGRKGNPGEGGIETFTGELIKPIIEDALANGIGEGEYAHTAEDVKAALLKMPKCGGVLKEAIKLMMANATALPKDIMANAPERLDMPKIGKEEIATIVAVIKSGVVDYTKPYSKAVTSLMSKGIGEQLYESISSMLRSALKQ